ncbi:MAG: SDR family NAD(P)-dependent oxidoreductase [Candidatus Magasanikbacteria bacterium]|nr:SDR family NAD(P)-dependent oxidoreductase [Candidatus Magasanikbacteria bacterium]
MADFYTGKKVVVTGGAGFIGSRVVSFLCERGAQVVVTVRKESDPWRLAELQSRLHIVECDGTDREMVRGLIMAERPEIIFNLASLVNTTQSLDVMDEVLHNNFLTTKYLLEAARDAGVRKFVQVGTIEEYGLCPVPFFEDEREVPISPYSLSNVMATHLALLYNRMTNLSVTVVRPAATYGPKQNFTMLTPVFIRAALLGNDFEMNPGGQIKDLIFVDDVALGMLLAGEVEGARGEIINLGSGHRYNLKEVVLMINQLMGNPVAVHFGAHPYRPLDPMRFYMDSHKARRLLGWHARTDLISGMKKTVRWYTEHYADVH